MSDHITVRPATLDELDTVAELWDEAARWLASRRIDQWQYPPRRHAIAHNIAAGDQCWLVEEDGQVIGTISLDDCADAEFWRPEDEPESALYAHRMVTIREVAGREIGSALLDWASLRRPHWTNDGSVSMPGAPIPSYNAITPIAASSTYEP